MMDFPVFKAIQPDVSNSIERTDVVLCMLLAY